MKKILIVFGTRPEAIKMASVVKELQKFPDFFHVAVCVTGQHREMLDQVLKVFKIQPEHDLNIMTTHQDLVDVTTQVLIGMRSVYDKENPDIVMVQGDTGTSMATALSAFYQRIPVAHVEAGLRTNQRYSPWPEEINRQLISRLATCHFTPTMIAKQNLLRENIEEKYILVTGNTVIDALHYIINYIQTSSQVAPELITRLKVYGYDMNRLNEHRRMILITSHRRENIGEGLINICNAIKYLSGIYPSLDFVYPVHLNPNVQITVNDILGKSKQKNIFLIPPVEYIAFLYLMKNAYLILTDSGGIQEEAPSFGKPVLVMRDTTERPEAIQAGTAKLVGSCVDSIILNVCNLIENQNEYSQMLIANNPYGDGTASKQIVNYLVNQFG